MKKHAAISTTWHCSPLEDVCDIILGQSPPGDTYNMDGNGLPFFQGKAEFGDLYPTPRKWCSAPTKIAEAEDVLISVRAPVGPTNLCPSRACIGRGLAAIRPRGGMPSRYVLYALRASVAALSEKATGTTFEAVNGTDLRTHLISVAPLSEQRRIVAEIEKQFTRLDSGIAALRRVQANLKRYRAAVLKAACEGRLVPTEAELAKKRKEKFETGEALLARILSERRKNWTGRGQFKEPTIPDVAKLRPLPHGWTWLTVETIGFVTKLAGFEYTKYVKYSPDGDLAVIKAENAGRNGYKPTEISRIKSSTVAHLTRSQLKAGDLLMVFVGAGTGNVARVPNDQPYFLGPNIGMIRVDPHYVSEVYLELFLRSPIGHALTFGFIKAVAQPSLSMGTIRMIPVALPPLAEQTRIVAEVERRLSVVDELETVVTANLQRATRLRQSILREAFTGRMIS